MCVSNWISISRTRSSRNFLRSENNSLKNFKVTQNPQNIFKELMINCIALIRVSMNLRNGHYHTTIPISLLISNSAEKTLVNIHYTEWCLTFCPRCQTFCTFRSRQAYYVSLSYSYTDSVMLMSKHSYVNSWHY